MCASYRKYRVVTFYSRLLQPTRSLTIKYFPTLSLPYLLRPSFYFRLESKGQK